MAFHPDGIKLIYSRKKAKFKKCYSVTFIDDNRFKGQCIDIITPVYIDILMQYNVSTFFWGGSGLV